MAGLAGFVFLQIRFKEQRGKGKMEAGKGEWVKNYAHIM